MARVCEAAWKLLPLPGEPPMTTFRSWLLTQECTIDISKARDELGYEPIVSHEQGLAELRNRLTRTSGLSGMSLAFGREVDAARPR